jgi:hypothetical protein
MEPDRSSAADNLWNTNPDLHLNEILNNIKTGASRGTVSGPSITYMMAPFAALLVRLSRDAEATAASVNQKTQSLIVMTRVLVVMTGILIVLTIPLAVIELHKFVIEITHKAPVPPQKSGNVLESD